MSRPYLLLLTCLAWTGIALISARLSAKQTEKLNLTIEDVMTPQELKDTGLLGLTALQRTTFNSWLNRYTQTVMKVARGNSVREPLAQSVPSLPSTSPACKNYPNTGEKESITENAHGKILILLDGSMWQVLGIDTIDSSLWLPVEDVIVIRAERPIGCYLYTIINTEEHDEKVQAEYLGQR